MKRGVNLEALSIVLVRPKFPENIGSVARVMKNMGLSRLILVDGCSPLHANAYKVASGAEDILERAEELPSLTEAISDTGCVVGTTSREGEERRLLLSPRDLMKKLIPLSMKNAIALVFGPEREGLTNEELSLCHILGRIPSSTAFPSLNLSHAVMIFCYEVFQSSLDIEGHPSQLAKTEDIPVVIFIITATSNAVNLTDGLDGLAIGVIAIVMIALAGLSYVSGNVIFSDYLKIIYLPGSGELTVFVAALVGASLGFLWYNAYPAQVFMGDTGSLALGGAFGILAVMIRKELFILILGGVFFMETLSVIIQKIYFKYTKKKFGQGKRVFKMAPIHHHFEILGWAEPKIVVRFYIIAIILAIVTLISFKRR